MKLKIKNKENIYLSPYTPMTRGFALYLKDFHNITIKGYIDNTKDETNVYNPLDIDNLDIDNLIILSPNWDREIYDNLSKFIDNKKLTIITKEDNSYKIKDLSVKLIDKIMLKILDKLFKYFNIQVTKLWTNRIGEFCLENEAFLDKIKNDKSYQNQNFILLSYQNEKDIANKTLYDMYRMVFKKHKNIYLFESNFINKYFQYLLDKKFIQKKYICKIEQKSNAYELFTNKKPIIKFTKKDIINGDKILKKLNITKPFVCVFARDSKYLDSTFEYHDWRYHDYRDADIDTYELAIKYLISKGYTVVRIGKVVNKKVSFKHTKYIDYPYSDFQSDFMDIFLISQCKFIIGGTSGLVDVSCAFSIPRIGVNHIPIDHSPYSSNKDIFIPKKLIYNNRYIGLQEYLSIIKNSDLSYWDSNTYKKLNLMIEDNTEDEILWLVKEYLGDYSYNDEDRLNQRKYQKIHLKSEQFKEVLTNIGSDFLKKNSWFIE